MARDSDDIPESELLALPDSSINPKKLSEIWALRAAFHVKQDITELLAELNGISRSRRLIGALQTPREIEERERRDRQRANERQLRDIQERTDRLLARIAEEERLIEIQRLDIDRRAITLRDGRKAYVAGSGYVDAQGRGLAGHDYADAAGQRRPDSATWQEKRANEEAHLELVQMRHDIQEARVKAAISGQNFGEAEIAARGRGGEEAIRKNTELLDREERSEARLETEHRDRDAPLDNDALGGADYMAAFDDTRNTSYAATLDGAKTGGVTKSFSAAVQAENSEIPAAPAAKAWDFKPT